MVWHSCHLYSGLCTTKWRAGQFINSVLGSCLDEKNYWDVEEDTCHWRNISNTLLDLSRGPCPGLPPVVLEFFFMGMRRSRAAFQPCWWSAEPLPKKGIDPGSTFSFPTEIQGHQSLCWARGSNAFLGRSPSWFKREAVCNGQFKISNVKALISNLTRISI